MGWIILICLFGSYFCYRASKRVAGAVLVGVAAYFGGIELVLSLIVVPVADAWSLVAFMGS